MNSKPAVAKPPGARSRTPPVILPCAEVTNTAAISVVAHSVTLMVFTIANDPPIEVRSGSVVKTPSGRVRVTR